MEKPQGPSPLQSRYLLEANLGGHACEFTDELVLMITEAFDFLAGSSLFPSCPQSSLQDRLNGIPPESSFDQQSCSQLTT